MSNSASRKITSVMNLLLIDDDSGFHILMGKMLDRFGKENALTVNITNFSDPVQGLFQLSEKDQHFDIVILDLRMPKLGGDDIYAFLMRKKPHLLENVLFVTGYRDDLEERFPDQKFNVLDKPFRYEQFASALRGITGLR